MARSSAWITWSSWAWTPSSCFRWPSSPARAGGVTTGSTCSPRTTPTAGRTVSSGWSTRRTATAWAWCWTSSTTIWARPGTTCRSSARTSRRRHQTNWGAAINFDGPGSDEVRRFVIDNALAWLRDYHCDGLRLDAVHAIRDDSATHILEELAAEVGALAAHAGRPLFLIAESDLNDPRFVRSRDAGGYGLDAAWADEWHHALHAALTGEASGYYEDFGSLPLLAKALRQAWVYDGTYSPHRGRVHGRPPAGLDGSQFVVCTQNHDQVGNRAVGERSEALMSDGRLRVAAALLLTSPFVPMLFQGEEWGASTPFQYFTSHADPELGQTVSAGRRREFAAFRLGSRARCLIPRTRPPSSAPGWSGPSWARSRTPACWPGTGG